MKVSFDFDSTLDRKPLQEYAMRLIKRGIEVWICTSRYNDENLEKKFGMRQQYALLGNKDLYEVADLLWIPKENIIFTNMKDKYHDIINYDFIWHLDDDEDENFLINKHTETVGIDSLNPDWKYKCEQVLRAKEDKNNI